jgi:uncharacterized membrane protein
MKPKRGPAQANIESVARLEQEFLDQRTAIERSADRIADLVGSFKSVAAHAAGIAFWLLINTGKIPGIPVFDPFPFIFLALTVSTEAIFLTMFVLMKQNRMARRADHRAHVNLQIDLLAEKEVTKVLQVLTLICERLGIQEPLRDREAREMREVTSVDTLSRQIRDRMPEEEAGKEKRRA